MSRLNLESIATNRAMEQVVATTAWRSPETPKRLRIAPSLGWLVCVSERGDPESLVGFSVESVGHDGILQPPRDLPDVKSRLDDIVVGLFNTDMTAKGIGSVLTNTPQALQPHSVRGGEIAVRRVPFTSRGELRTRDSADTPLHQKARLARHATLLFASAMVDRATHSTTGTERAIHFMERKYGSARLVQMPAPPIWQQQQRNIGTLPEIPPQIVLVRGGDFAPLNPMEHIGSYPVPNGTQPEV